MTTKAPQETAERKLVWLDKNVVRGFMIELCEDGYEIK